MQIDMHYYGTYALARAAGFSIEAAQTIATCAQFVDDAAEQDALLFEDGSGLYCQPTAHHSSQAVRQYISQEVSKDDQTQREIWVPFHFLPGNQGDSFSDRLKCRKNSIIAQQMVKAHLTKGNEPFGLHLLGITAHVYADTFSHYGFSGVSSRGNMVDSDSFQFHNVNEASINYLESKKDSFMANIGSWMMTNFRTWISDGAETATGALGHGSVMTFPDLPYLDWSVTYERSGITDRRNNTQTFMEACQALYDMFYEACSRFEAHHVDVSNRVPFGQLAPVLEEVIAYQNGKNERAQRWRDIFADGTFLGRSERLPDYDGETWLSQISTYRETRPAAASDSLLSEDLYHFYQAARYHRTFILRDLLPKHDLAVS